MTYLSSESASLSIVERPGWQDRVPNWLPRVLDRITPRMSVKLGSLKPRQAFAAVYDQEGYSGRFSGRIVRHSDDGRQVLVVYFAWVGGEPGIYAIWRDSSIQVWHRLTCPQLDLAAA